MKRRATYGLGVAVLAAGFGVAGLAAADEAPAKWSDTLTYGAQFDVGISHDGGTGPSGRIFGRLFDDTSDRLQLNQAMLSAARPLDPAATGYDFGFKLQGFYGSDARFTRFTKQFVSLTNSNVNQFDIVEANAQLHAPWLSDGGVDLKFGQYSTPIGTETIDPSANYFYSHSYLFFFSDPLKHTGLLATWHASAMVDLYASIDTGINTGFENFPGHAQNGGPPAFLGGVGVTLNDGALTFLALTHIGTEIPSAAIANGLLPKSVSVDSASRRIFDLVTTWKASDKLTLINELNYLHDDALDNGRAAEGWGVAQYASFAASDSLSLVARGEIFRDSQNAFVGQYGNNADYLRSEEGYAPLSPYTVTGGPLGSGTTYGALTIGLNWKPSLNLPHLTSLTIRPELREDTALSGGHPFNDGKDRSQTTLSVDAVIAF
jgi:hypothetical protein